MRKPCPMCVALGIVAVGAAIFAYAGDPPKIERTIRKEPVYKSKTPKYCLLTFGRKGETRAWVVLDEDVFYIDRNGNGDLTEPDKRVPIEGKTQEKGEDGQGFFTTPLFEEELVDLQGKRLQPFDISFEHSADYRQSVCRVVVREGKLPRIGSVMLSDRPGDAEVFHLDGPLSLRLAEPDATALARGKDATELCVCVGNFSPKTEVLVQNKAVPATVHPLAEIEFPGKDPGSKAIQVRVVLDRRC